MAEASDQRPAPSATGTLSSRPLVHLLVYARSRRLSGKLEVHAVDGRNGTIELWRGQICGARTVPAVAYFGALAYELGCIDTSTLDATLLEIAKSKRLHGEVLVERGAITPLQRDDLLAEQACRKIHFLFSLPGDSTFAFYDARPAVTEPPLLVDPIKPAWRGLRESPPAESVREVLGKFATTALRLVNEGPVARAGFSVEEAALCNALLSKPMTLAQLRVASHLPTARVDLLAYLLVITKCAEPSMAPVPSAPASSPSVSSRPPTSGARGPIPAPLRAMLTPPGGPPVRVSTPGLPAVRPSSPGLPAMGSGEVRRSLSFRVPSMPPPAEGSSSRPSSRAPAAPAPTFGPAELGAAGIASRALAIGSESYFDALGLTESASPEAARASYFRLAKLWHPERLPADLMAFRGEVETIFSHISRAHATLTDPEALRAYLATRAQSTAASVVAQKPRKEVVREIETALGKREFQSAEHMSRALAAANAEDHEALALAAWASSFAAEAPEEALRAALVQLDKVVKSDAYCERAFYYRGALHKRLGNPTGAFRDFARCAQIDPKHVDAQRELRIFEMRARKGSGEHGLDALLSKVKKK